MTDKIKIAIKRHGTGEYAVKVTSVSSDAFSDAIEWLKLCIDKYDRRYSPELKTWIISSSGSLHYWLDKVNQHYDLIVDYPETVGVKPNQNPQLTAAFTVLYLTPDAPLEVIKSSYKALSRLYHPDVAGEESTAQMVLINQAYQQITESK